MQLHSLNLKPAETTGAILRKNGRHHVTIFGIQDCVQQVTLGDSYSTYGGGGGWSMQFPKLWPLSYLQYFGGI